MDDLTGGPDDRVHQLAALGAEPDPAWLRRQLELALQAWAAQETTLDILKDSHEDY